MKLMPGWLLCAVYILSVAGPAHSAKLPFIVTISATAPATKTGPDAYAVKAGADIFIKVRITNTSNRDIVLGDACDDRVGVDGYDQYEIRDSNQRSCSRKQLQHPEIPPTSHGWVGRTLKPGASMNVGEDRITGLYDLTQPGQYTVQVSRAVSDSPQDGAVKSNTITVTVAESAK